MLPPRSPLLLTPARRPRLAARGLVWTFPTSPLSRSRIPLRRLRRPPTAPRVAGPAGGSTRVGGWVLRGGVGARTG
eukprot:10739602-Alexandrium_andersonii.AAC.1